MQGMGSIFLTLTGKQAPSKNSRSENLRQLFGGLFRFSKKQDAAEKAMKRAEALRKALVAEKAGKILTLATSLKETVPALYAAKAALHAAPAQGKKEAQKRFDDAITDLQARIRTFAKALTMNKTRFDCELNALLEDYRKLIGHALDPAMDFHTMSRKIIAQSTSLVDAISKIEHKVSQLQK